MRITLDHRYPVVAGGVYQFNYQSHAMLDPFFKGMTGTLKSADMGTDEIEIELDYGVNLTWKGNYTTFTVMWKLT